MLEKIGGDESSSMRISNGCVIGAFELEKCGQVGQCSAESIWGAIGEVVVVVVIGRIVRFNLSWSVSCRVTKETVWAKTDLGQLQPPRCLRRNQRYDVDLIRSEEPLEKIRNMAGDWATLNGQSGRIRHTDLRFQHL